ncbi:MAG: transposase [Candidatus Shapirobacteria bacterium]|nr:transposase [Candidatus Shapirobacteria bacterium]
MPYRKTIFANNEIYHTINRSIEEQTIFKGKRDYQRALDLIDFYRYNHPSLRFSHYNRLPKNEKEKFIKNLKENGKPVVEILAFCLMSNHFHFLLRQTREKGIQSFMRNFQDSFARYFNTKYHRSGLLFQGMFKAVRIETDEQLTHVSRYIHLNPVSSYITEIGDLEKYPWSSFPEYLSQDSLKFTNPSPILDLFKSRASYKEFVFNQADYQRRLQKIKHLALER